MTGLRYPLLVSDMDGTLLSTKHELHDETIQSIQEYHKAGGLFTIATGRNFVHAKPYLEQLDIQIPAIVSDGSILYDPADDKLHVLSNLDWSDVQFIANQCTAISQKLDLFLFSYHPQIDAHRVYSTTESAMIESYAAAWMYEYQPLRSYDELIPDAHVINLFVHIQEPEDLVPFKAWCMEQKTNYTINFWTDEFVAIAPKHSNKGAAIKHLSQRLSIPLEQVAGIGDHLNDLPMSLTVGLFAAMANAQPAVKESTNIIVPHHDDAGVAHFIRHHLLKTPSA